MHRGVRRGASDLCSTRAQIDGLKARGMLAWLPILLADGIKLACCNCLFYTLKNIALLTSTRFCDSDSTI